MYLCVYFCVCTCGGRERYPQQTEEGISPPGVIGCCEPYNMNVVVTELGSSGTASTLNRLSSPQRRKFLFLHSKCKL